MSLLRDFTGSARAHGAPATVALVAAIAVSFLVIWVSNSSSLILSLAFSSTDVAARPWTLLTYPFAADFQAFLSVVFSCLWLWGIGGQVEREIGSWRYVVAWLIFTALSAGGLWIGSILLQTPSILWSAWNPIAAVTVIWGTRNPGAVIKVCFILPLTGRWVAWLSAGLVFFSTRPSQLAPFGAIALLLAFLFATQKLPFVPYFPGQRGRSRGENPAGTRKVYSKEYYDDVKRREQTRAEKERLRKLFEKSMIEDPDDDRPKG